MENLEQGIFDNIYKEDTLSFRTDNNSYDYRKIVKFLDFKTNDISKIAGVSKTSVRYDENIPDSVRERLEQIANICQLVDNFFRDNKKTSLWFKTLNPMLGNISPRDMIRLGKYDRLLMFVCSALKKSGN